MLGFEALGGGVVGDSLRGPGLGADVGLCVNGGFEVPDLEGLSIGGAFGEFANVSANFDGLFEVFDVDLAGEASSGGGGVAGYGEVELHGRGELGVGGHGILGLREGADGGVLLSLEDVSGEFDDGGLASVASKGELLLDEGGLGVGDGVDLGDVEVEGLRDDFAGGLSLVGVVSLHFVEYLFEYFVVLAVEFLVFLGDFGFFEHSAGLGYH